MKYLFYSIQKTGNLHMDRNRQIKKTVYFQHTLEVEIFILALLHEKKIIVITCILSIVGNKGTFEK